MSILWTMHAAYAGIFLYLSTYYCALYYRRRVDLEFLAFGALCGSLAVHTAGAIMLLGAADVADAAFAQGVQAVGVYWASPCFVIFALRMADARAPRAVFASIALGVVGTIAVVSGVMSDPSSPMPMPTWGFTQAPLLPLAAVTPVRQLLSVVNILLGAYAVWVLVRRARHDRDARVIAWASGLGILLSSQDVLAQSIGMRSYLLTPHAGMLWIIAVSYVLHGRFVRTRDDLAARTLELRRSYDDLRLAQEELVRKEQLATMGEFSAIVAHEVRNPLAVIKNAVSGLRRPTLAAADRDTLLGILDEEADRLNRLVNDLLSYARTVVPEGRSVAVRDLLERAVEVARKAFACSHIEFDIQTDGAPDTVHGDPDLLRQAFVNLIENGLQAMPEGGRMELVAAKAELAGKLGVVVRVSDTGEGMDTLVRQKALDPFFTTRPSGTGLGLAIVERIVRAHGGVLEIESQHGSGTTVSIVLAAGGRPSPPSGLPAKAGS